MSTPSSLLVVLGTRPEAIKLFPVIMALQKDARFTVRLCVTAQHRLMLDQVLALANISPDHDLDLMRPGQSLDALTAALLTGLGEIIDREQPARVIVQGDTATAMAGALAAHYRRVAVDHVEAGLRSNDLYAPWPEEANRRIISALASLHFAPTDTAAGALVAENVDPARIHVTGNPVIDALHWTRQRLADDPVLANTAAAIAARFAGRRMIVVTCHRRESWGTGTERIASAIARIAQRDDVGIVFPLHPNPAVRGAMQVALGGQDNVALVEALDYPNFVHLLEVATLVLTDSGGVQEEAPALGKPVLIMRETTERTEGIAAGTAQLVGTDTARIVAATLRLLDDPVAYAAMARAHNPFGDGRAAARIAALLAREIA